MYFAALMINQTGEANADAFNTILFPNQFPRRINNVL